MRKHLTFQDNFRYGFEINILDLTWFYLSFKIIFYKCYFREDMKMISVLSYTHMYMHYAMILDAIKRMCNDTNPI